MRRALAPLALVLAALFLALSAACSPARVLEAKRVLLDMSAGPGPSALKELTGTPDRQVLSFTVEGRRHAGQLYRPAAKPGLEIPDRPLVLVPGVTPQGLDDPRLVAFATTLARAGFLVLVPDIANLRALKVRASDSQPIADALRHLARPNEDAASRRVALAAISYAAGPAVLAALQPEVTPDLAFLLLIGGYYDMAAVVAFFTTGFYREAVAAPWRRGEPNAYGKWVFVRNNAEILNTPADRRLLAEIARRKMADLNAEVSDLAADLGPEGRSVLALLNNREPERVPDLMASLPAAIADNMHGLDLSGRDLSKLDLPVFLLHGRDDPVIPFTESQALAAALPDGAARLTLADNLSHVELTPGGLFDALTLWEATYRLLQARDRMAGTD